VIKPIPENSITSTQKPSRYVGGLIGLSGNVAFGWAKDDARPEVSVVVEILVDDQPYAVCTANQLHAEDDASHPDFYGFSFSLPERILAKADILKARVANQNETLGSPLVLGQQKKVARSAPASQLWYGGGLVLSGWLTNPERPGEQLEVTAREGSKIVARAIANRPHSALVNMPSAEHGFLLELPWSLGDGKPHLIDVTDQTGHRLTGSPALISFRPESMSRLLASLWPRGTDNAPLARERLDSLMQIVSSQERHSPPSIGLSQYPNWFLLHTQKLAATQLKKSKLHVMLMVTAGDAVSTATSIASVESQNNATVSATVVSGNLRDAIAKAIEVGADVVVPLPAGDQLAPLYSNYAATALEDPNVVWTFTDCDQHGVRGERTNPWLKPVWDPIFFLALDIVTPGSAWKASWLQLVLDHFATVEIADWESLSVLAAHYLYATKAPESSVVHQASLLYHRSARAPAQPHDLPRSHDARRHLERFVSDMDCAAVVTQTAGHPHILRTIWPLPVAAPMVTLIVPTRDQHRLLSACVEGLLRNTDYPDLEIIVVDNLSSDPETLAYLEDLERRGVRVLRYPHPFNYSAINNFAVEHARGEVIGLINNDIEVIDGGWLREMVSQLLRPGVGAVGAKLLWKNGMVQHSGIVVGVERLAAHIGNSWHRADPGYLGTNQATRRQEAVTAACLILKREVFLKAGGLDSVAFPISFNDVDLCLRLRAQRLEVVFAANAELYHLESASRGKDISADQLARAQREQNLFMMKWCNDGNLDSFYSRHLNRNGYIPPFSCLSI